MRRKEEASKVKQTNKAKQHSTPKVVAFPKKNELPWVGLEPTTLYTLDRALYHCICMYKMLQRCDKDNSVCTFRTFAQDNSFKNYLYFFTYNNKTKVPPLIA